MTNLIKLKDLKKEKTVKSDTPNHVASPFADALAADAKKHLEAFRPIPHSEILPRLLQEIHLVDFFRKAQIHQADENTENFKISEKHKIVMIVNEVMEIARRNAWGLCRNLSFVYIYNGAFWSQLDTDELESFLAHAAERMGINALDAQHFEYRQKLRKQFLAAGHLPAPLRDRNTILINLKNGTFEISPDHTQLRSPNFKDFLTYQLPFEYKPDAIAIRWQAFLNEVQPDSNRQKILAEYMGYIFISQKVLKLEKALLLYGTGANGKSVFFEVVTALLGEQNVSSFSLQNLTNDNGYYRAKLANKLVNYASEINGSLDAAIFKQLVSGEPVDARLPYGEPLIISEYAKLIFNCNGLPKDVEQTNAYFRRFLILPFDVTIPEDKQDKELSKKIIQTELPGVFNWVLQGLERLLQQKNFTYSEAVQKQVERYKLESDSVKMFLEENNYRPSPTQHKLVKDLYISYRAFCGEDGFRPVSKTTFIARLKNDGILIEKKNRGNVAFLAE